MRIGILEGTDFSDHAIKSLKKIGSVDVFDPSKSDIASFLKDKEVLFVRLKWYLNEELLEGAKNLKYICSPTTGSNHIDLSYLESKNITLISLKGESAFLSNIRATPEHTFGLVLALLRKYKFVFSRAPEFKERDAYKGEEIYRKRVGIIGFGRVGTLMARYLEAFNAEVSFVDIRPDIQTSIKRYDTLKLLIENNDIIILSCNYTKENEKMMNKDVLKWMKDKYFINTARGELVDEDALIEYLESDHFKGVALDVLANETGTHNLSRIRALTHDKNVILTPHISGATVESMATTEEFIVKKLENYI